MAAGRTRGRWPSPFGTTRAKWDDPTNTLTLAAPDGTLRADVMVHARLDRAARRVFVAGRTDQSVRGQGVGSAALRWGLARAREILRDENAGVPRYAEAWAGAERADADALLRGFGFAPVRWYLEMRRVFAGGLPEDVPVGDLAFSTFSSAVEADPTFDELVRLAHNDAFADHWGSEPVPASVWGRDFTGNPFHRPDLSLVALNGSEIAGYAVNYVAESDWTATGVREGWIGQLGVRRAWRRRGLATALLVRSMQLFQAAGMEAVSLGVDADNPTGAVGVYERVGFRPTRRDVRYRLTFEDLPEP